MCDPVTMLVGVASAGLATVANKPRGGGSAPAQPDPAAERAKAEAEAAQRANAQLAMDQRRRREQGSLLSKGNTALQPGFTMGDEGAGAGPSPLSTGGRLTSRSTAARAKASLMSRASTGGGGGFGGAGGARGQLTQDVAL